MALIRITRRVVIVLCCGAVVFLLVSLLRTGRSVSDSEAVLSEEHSPEPRVVSVHAPEEIVELRDRTTRIYKVIREVEISDPVTRETRVEETESRIIEKGDNLCYRDDWGSFVPSIAAFEAVPGGFVADRNSFGLGVGETLGQGLTASLGGWHPSLSGGQRDAVSSRKSPTPRRPTTHAPRIAEILGETPDEKIP